MKYNKTRTTGESEMDVPEGLPPDPGSSYNGGNTLTFDGSAHETNLAALRERLAELTGDSDPLAGTEGSTPMVAGGYRLIRPLGQGGFGEVWESVQGNLSRIIAVKKLREDFYVQSNLERLKQLEGAFRQEALTAAKLDHPNIVPIYDLGSDEQGRPLLAMKLVNGRPWSHVIEEDFDILPADQFLAKHLPILIDVAHAAAFAHARGIVHRDIKPSQVMVGDYGEVLLMDWGLAHVFDVKRAIGDHEDVLPMLGPQMSSSPAGTPSFMAPEQTERDLANTGPWTDVFLLGGVLYFLLTRQPPHVAEDSEAAFRMARACRIRPPREVTTTRLIPSELERLAMEALAPKPADRVPSAEVFVARLNDYLTGATRRRESEELSAEAATLLENAGGDYRAYGEALSKLRQAEALWTGNPQIGPLQNLALVENTRAAMENNDLVMARVQSERIDDPEKKRELSVAIAELERRRRVREQQRRIALGGLVVLLMGLAGGFAKYNFDQRQANLELQQQKDRAEDARRVAEQAELEALRQMVLAEEASAEAMRQKDIAENARVAAEREQYFSAISIAETHLQDGRVVPARDVLLERSPAPYRQWEWGHLLAKVHPEILMLQNEDQMFNAVYTPDGRHIVTGDVNSVAMWDAASGRLEWKTRAATHLFWAVAISNDGSRILAGSFDRTAVIIDRATGAVLHRLEGHTGVIRSAAISPDGRIGATGSTDRTARLYDMETGELIRTISALPGDVYYLDFSPDGSLLAMAHLEEAIALVDVASGETIRTIGSGDNNAFSVVFTPDGAEVVACHNDKTIRSYEVATGNQTVEIPIDSERYPHHTRVSPDGRLVACADSAGVAQVFELSSGNLVAAAQLDDPMWRVTFSPDGSRLLTTSRRSVRVLDLANLRGDFVVDETPTSEAFASSEPIQVYGLTPTRHPGWADKAAPWNVRSGATQFSRGPENYLFISSLSEFSPNGRFRADIAPDNAYVSVLDTVSGSEVFRADRSEELAATVSFGPDSRVLAIANFKNVIRVYDTSAWQEVALLEKDPQRELEGFNVEYRINDVAFSHGGQYLAAGYYNGIVTVWDTTTWKEVHNLDQVSGAGRSLAFSHDDQLLAAGGTNDVAAVWNLENGEVVSRLSGHRRASISIDISPDKKRLVTSSDDGTVKLWDTESGREVLTLLDLGSNQQALGAKFTRDGRRIVIPTTTREIVVLETLPWDVSVLPGPETMSKDSRLELQKRRERISNMIQPADVAMAPQEPAPDQETEE